MGLFEAANAALRAALPREAAPLGPCPSCGADALGPALAARGPDALTAADLAHYAERAGQGWGTAEHFAVLLPRLAELTHSPAALTARGLSWRAHARTLEALRFERWAPARRAAVVAWADALWAATCAGELPAWDALEVLYLATRFAPQGARERLDTAFQDGRARKVRRALVAEIALVDGRVEGWFAPDPAPIEAALAAGDLTDAEAAARKVHPAEPAVRIWFCDPWRGVELSEEAAAARGPDQSVWRRRMLRWKRAIEG